ncbi:perforin-1-like [Engraulis encrasicolus]|uniref:perforin-1-like n=1 Tax=Engraulis encrasicolus TaxID=184585 RepID=UPI002FD71E7F
MGQPSLPRLHLCGLLLFALLSPASCTCRVGKREECMEAPFVPGHDLVGEGFDIVKMARKRAYTIDVQTYLRDDGTCQLCENDEMDNELQKLPLSVVDWRSNSKVTGSLTSESYSSVKELVRSTGSDITNDWTDGLDIKKFGLGAEVEVGMGKSVSSRFALQMAKEDYYTFTVHEFNCTYYSFRVSSQASVNREFSLDINRLPKEYNEKTKRHYKQLINTYGTHYLDKVNLGGKIKTVTAIRTCLASLKGQSTEEVKNCLSGKLSLTFGLPVSPNISHESCFSVFNNENTTVTSHNAYFHQVTEMTPGEVMVGSLSSSYNDYTGFRLWFDQLKEDPGVVSYSLNPLSRLITDKVIQANVITAIQQYLKENAVSPPSGSLDCKSGNCCPSEPHKATLKINSIRASGLSGDFWSRTDAFAKVRYGSQTEKTNLVRSDNPQWKPINFGTVFTIDDSSLHVDVYDEDVFNFQHLGSCSVKLAVGSGTKTCSFGRSTVTLTYTLTCAAHLTGDKCQVYSPQAAYTSP